MKDVAYVTRHTYKKLVGTYIEANEDTPMDTVFSNLFEQSLQPILNKKEALKLYSLQQMLSGAASSPRPVKKYFSNRYVFKVNPPKYHADKNCKYLTSDFKNYLVPPSIEALGPGKVKEFQEYCEDIRKDYEDKPDDLFWANVGARFRVSIAPQTVEYENSGVQDISKMTVEELKAQVDKKFTRCLEMLDSKEYGQTLLRLRYAPHVERAISSLNETALKQSVEEFFRLKWRVIDTLFELYRKEAHEDDYVLPIDLLASIGLDVCKGCQNQRPAAT